MADDSPGKVQALRAIFSEKNQPLMGMLPQNAKNNRPWRSTTIEPSEQLAKAPASKNGIRPRPAPKPTRLSQPTRTTAADHQDKSKAVAETIASFMFANGIDKYQPSNNSQAADSRINSITNSRVESQINSHQTDSSNNLRTDSHINSRIDSSINSRVDSPNNFRTDSQSELCKNAKNNIMVKQCNAKNAAETLRISSDNYICKSSSNFRRKELPSLEVLGSPPAKPDRPSHVVLPAKYRPCPPVPARNTQPPVTSPPAVPLRPGIQRPSHPCPPRPHTPPPLPPVSAPVIKPRLSLREEIEELYEDTLLGDRPVSLIPEFTEEEESEELYNDAGPDEAPPPLPPATPKKPKEPPPPCPSEYLQPNVQSSGSCEELYHDAEDPDHEEFYEEMPCETLVEENESPMYSNNKKEIEKMKREEEKKLRKEQKEKEKRDKELEKLRKKFGLTGEEVPIDDGLVKADSRGGKGDLPVKRGEVVLILRMEGNPSGRWLVKNEKGKIGYVELTNIEVDPLSVKSVMSIRRFSVISASEELYNEAKSYSDEEEGIYEVTY